MIEFKSYKDFVLKTFSFLITEFKMDLGKETINGNVFYDIQYADKNKIISISLETIGNYFQVTLFILDNGKLPDYDDKTRTIHLNKLNKDILLKLDRNEFDENNIHFKNVETKDQTKRRILKSAKDLRLCLNHYFV